MFGLNLSPPRRRNDGSDNPEAEQLLQQQSDAADQFNETDSELQDIELELADAQEALADAQKRVDEAQGQYGPATAKVDQAYDVWSSLSQQLDAMGVDEQYRIEDAYSDYAKENYI